MSGDPYRSDAPLPRKPFTVGYDLPDPYANRAPPSTTRDRVYAAIMALQGALAVALAGLIGYGAALASMDPATSSGDARFLIRTLVFGCVGGAAFVFYGRRMFHPRPWEDTFGLSVRFVGLTSVNVIQAWPFVVAMVRVWH